MLIPQDHLRDKTKSGERERVNKSSTEQIEEAVIVIELNSKDNKMSEQTDQQKTVIEQLCEQTDMNVEQALKMNEQTIEQTIARIELDISNQQNKPKLQPGQQSVKSYFKVMDRQTQAKSSFSDGTEDLRTSDTVTSDEGRKRLIV